MTIISKEPGLHEQIMPENGQHYTIFIPDDVADIQSLLLVVVLHWGGPVTPYYGRSILAGLVAPALSELKAIMAAPDCRHDDWANPQSEVDVLDMIEFLCQTYLINRDRILLTGYSMGGIGTWYLSARNQDQFSAAIPMASIPPQAAFDVDWGIPIYAINSRRDELFSYQILSDKIVKLIAKGAAIELHTLDSVTHYDAAGYIHALRASIPWIRSVLHQTQ